MYNCNTITIGDGDSNKVGPVTNTTTNFRPIQTRHGFTIIICQLSISII